MTLDTGVWVLTGVLASIGILSPLSTLWQTVTVSRGMGGTLAVKTRRILGGSHEWPLEAMRSIGVIVQEHIIRVRGAPSDVGHLWRVGVVDKDGHWCIELQVDRTKTGPLQRRMSKKTQECVEALEQITGLPCTGSPVLIEHGRTPQVMSMVPGVMPESQTLTGRRSNIAQHVATSKESHTYDSLDEMPPEIRARAEAMLAERGASGASSFTSQTITITDASGQTRTYHSPEEMPPDVRARYEEARKGLRNE
jgi:hypothetical protein